MHQCVYANTGSSTEQYDEHGGERKRPLQQMAGARHVHDQYDDEVDPASDTRRDDTRRDGMPAKVRLYLGSFKAPLREMFRSDSRAIVLYIYVYWLPGSAVRVHCNAVFRCICML